MKLFILLFAVLLSPLSFSNDNYYSAITNETGAQLKSALKNIIKRSHKDRGYSALFNVYSESDRDRTYDRDGSIVDMYSENPNGKDPYNFKSKNKKCGTYKGEADCYNREHIFPQSSFRKASPMRADFFHVYPSDGYVNNRRGRYPFGEVKNAKWTSKNGSKVGLNTFEGVSVTAFEPIDEFKGDIARALFYFATRYQDRITSFNHEWLDGSRHQVYRGWFSRLLLKWHKQDPVSAHERNRNNAGYSFQGNRNPFIDHPEWVQKIWVKSRIR